MSEQNNLGVVRMGYDAFGRGDIEALLALLDENVEWITPGPSEIRPRARAGGDRPSRVLRHSARRSSHEFRAREICRQGDRVVCSATTRRLKATGKVLAFAWFLLWREERQDRQLPRVRRYDRRCRRTEGGGSSRVAGAIGATRGLNHAGAGGSKDPPLQGTCVNQPLCLVRRKSLTARTAFPR